MNPVVSLASTVRLRPSQAGDRGSEYDTVIANPTVDIALKWFTSLVHQVHLVRTTKSQGLNSSPRLGCLAIAFFSLGYSSARAQAPEHTCAGQSFECANVQCSIFDGDKAIRTGSPKTVTVTELDRNNNYLVELVEQTWACPICISCRWQGSLHVGRLNEDRQPLKGCAAQLAVKRLC